MNENIKLVMTITSINKEKKFGEYYEKKHFSFVLYGRSMASKSLLSYFGLKEVKRSILLTIISEYEEESFFKKITKKIDLNKPGNGVVCSVPISSSNKYIYDKVKKKPKEENALKKINDYHLVITIIKEGYFDLVMNASKKVGARSGTLISGREISNKQFAEFLGFSIEPERDIVLLLVKEDIREKLMNEITLEAGLKTNGRGICLSIPVDNVLGLEEEKEEKINNL